jgi:flagellar basal-body rod modification protein FlgD
MLIESTDTTGTGPGTALPTTIEKTELSQDYDMFLRLMTAQLKNQDPLQPLDGTEFVAQLAQFSGVEQQIKTNERLDSLLGALTRSPIAVRRA